MKLKQYLRENNLRVEDFAIQNGWKVSTVYSWCADGKEYHRRPKDPKIFQKIKIATGGAVTPNDFY